MRIIDEIKNRSIKRENQASFKGSEISKRVFPIPKTKRGDFFIKIQELKAIPNGLEVLVRAWDKDDNQVGFGKDGSVEIERIRIFNPPILVDDPNGDIVREWIGKFSGETHTRTLREDPKEALLQSLEHTIKLITKDKPRNKIIKGKVGNTTSTFYPAAGTVEPVDGVTWRGVALPGETFSTIRNGAGVSVDNTGIGDDPWFTFLRATTTTNQYDNLARSIFGFDTSSIPDTDDISSATFSIYGFGTVENSMSLSIAIDKRVPASTSALAASDYNIAGWAGAEQASNRITYASWSTSGYNDFTLNATGIGNVSKTGLSWYGCRLTHDLDNTTPTWSSGAFDKIRGYFADQTGTANDPKLVVEHGATVIDINVNDSVTVAENVSIEIDINISINDQVTVSENITIELSLSDINISDSVIVSESVTAENTELGDISIFDSVTVSEDINLVFVFDISVSDSVIVSESVTAENIELGDISIFDSVTVSESITAENTELGDISIFDSVTVSESITVENTTLGGINVNDAITITESISGEININVNISDQVTISESITISLPERNFVLLRSRGQDRPVTLDRQERPLKMSSKQQSRPLPMDDKRVL